MFSKDCIMDKPLIQTRDEYRGVPDNFQQIWSAQFWFYLDQDFIDKIVAVRVYPYQDYIVFKLLPRGATVYTNLVLRNAELRILKRLWECNHPGVNFALKEYLTHSNSAFQQWVKRLPQNIGCADWYMQQNLGLREDG